MKFGAGAEAVGSVAEAGSSSDCASDLAEGCLGPADGASDPETGDSRAGQRRTAGGVEAVAKVGDVAAGWVEIDRTRPG